MQFCHKCWSRLKHTAYGLWVVGIEIDIPLAASVKFGERELKYLAERVEFFSCCIHFFYILWCEECKWLNFYRLYCVYDF